MQGLPDIIDYNLKVLFVGYNPGLRSAELGHHYAGYSNSFWKLLYESGLTPYRLKPEEDTKLLTMGYGSTNLVARPSKSAAELTAVEFKEGAVVLTGLFQKYKPRIACYVGIGIYKAFSRRKDVACDLQEDSVVEGVLDYVCTSPSGLNRMPYKQQLECFIGLKHFIDHLSII